MARLENLDRIRRTVIVLKYNPEEVDSLKLKQLWRLDKIRLRLIRELGRRVDIYIPDRHPLIEKKMVYDGRVVELCDVKVVNNFKDGKHQKYLSEKKSLFLIEGISELNDLTNILSEKTLFSIAYDEEKYHKISGVIFDEKEILRIPGVKEENL